MEYADWFRIDSERVSFLEQKDLLLAQCNSLTYQALPQSLPGARELYQKVCSWLTEIHPQVFEMRADQIFDHQRGVAHDLSSVDPLRALAQLVSEDLVLLHREQDEPYRMVAGCVCFPSNWSLAEKLGKTVQEIHEPVTELNALIGSRIDMFLDRMKPERPQTRSNFLINFDPTLSQIPNLYAANIEDRPSLNADTIGELLWLRSERETFMKLPLSNDILFTLRTYQMRVCDLSAQTAATVAALHRAIPDSYRDNYRKLDLREHQLLIEYLEKKSQG
jgi:dimethylamine monooxygenase subunit A